MRKRTTTSPGRLDVVQRRRLALRDLRCVRRRGGLGVVRAGSAARRRDDDESNSPAAHHRFFLHQGRGLGVGLRRLELGLRIPRGLRRMVLGLRQGRVDREGAVLQMIGSRPNRPTRRDLGRRHERVIEGRRARHSARSVYTIVDICRHKVEANHTDAVGRFGGSGRRM